MNTERVIPLSVITISLLASACSPPNVDSLDADIRAVTEEMAQVDTELEEYSGGLIGTLLSARKHALGFTKDMLEQKRASLLYWIELQYPVDGRVVEMATPEELDSILQDVHDLDAEIANAEIEAASMGGLIRGLSLAQVATLKLSRATVLQRYYASKHGIPIVYPPETSATESGGSTIVVDDPSQL